MRHGAISEQARLLAAVSELDASPAPATEDAARTLARVLGAIIPGEFANVYLGQLGVAFANVQAKPAGRLLADRSLRSPSAWDQEPPVVAIHDSTGLLVTCRRSDVGIFGSLRPTTDYGHYWRPFEMADMIGVRVGFPTEHAYLASYRTTVFSEQDVRTLDQLRPVASRLLRRASVGKLAEASARAWGLGPREAEVFALAGVGLSLPSIASILGLSVGTIRTHMGKAYAKTAVRTRAAATSALLDVAGSTALRDAGRGLVPGGAEPLTRRESAVLRVAASGRTTAAIASAIGISTETAKTHLANAYRKLGVQNRSQALIMLGTAKPSAGGSEPSAVGI
jgi:DNA-binding CsgD family transcriptional regulator